MFGVEDPPLPGFEATLKMLDDQLFNTGAVEHARESLKTIGIWTGLTMIAILGRISTNLAADKKLHY